MNAQPPSKPQARGVVFSVEALMAAMLLFAVLLLLSSLTGPIRAPKQALLEGYAQNILQIGAENGTWIKTSDATLGNDLRDDSDARALIESLPPSICAQVEVFYLDSLNQASWSYVRSGCGLRTDTPVAQRMGMIYSRSLFRVSPQPNDHYWVRVKTYPREG